MKLSELLQFNDIVIQCHDNPDADALASGFAAYTYLKSKGKVPRLVYGGRFPLQKSNLMLMKEELQIPIEYVSTLDLPELLLMVDCQYQGGNAQVFEAQNIAVIDHHQVSTTLPELSEVRSNLGSCATILYDMLLSENYDFSANTALATALYYGLLTDTNNFAELHHPLDKDLRDDMLYSKPLITLFRNSNLSFEELTIAGEALLGYEYNEEHRYAIAEAKPCDPNILGLISDMILEVHGVDSCVIYSRLPFGVKFSVRSCVKEVNAGELAEFIASKIGNGGGHREKAGGFLQSELMTEISDFPAHLHSQLCDYFGNTTIIYASQFEANISEFEEYRKKNLPIGYAKATDLLPAGASALVRTLEGDLEITISDDINIMIGIKGEVYPIQKSKFEKSYQTLETPYVFDAEYLPNIKDQTTGEKVDLLPNAHSCVSSGEVKILAKPITSRVKIFTAWDPEKYMLGLPGDYLGVRTDDLHDCYIVEKNIFHLTYEKA